MMTEQEYVKRCLEEICKRNGFGGANGMTQRNFEMLSDEIRSKTEVLLSVSTLKRLMNGEFSRIPQQVTLNTISGYLGFDSWQEYKNSISNSDKQTVQSQQSVPAAIDRNSFINWNRIAISFIIVAVVVFLGFARRSPSGKGYELATFSATKTTTRDIPNTVVFKYDVRHVAADSFFIQQSWDRNRRVKVDRNNHTLTDIYYEPGYHLAKLIADDSVIKTFGVGIPTDKWVYYAKERLDSPMPSYISVAGQQKGYLGFEKSDIINSLIDPEKELTYLSVYFPTVYGGSCDNFKLKCRVKVTDVRNNACPYIMCEVFGQHRFMFFRSTPPGCANQMFAGFGDVILRGQNTDLSALAMDVHEWQDVEFTVRDKHVNIRINGTDRYSAVYSVSPGIITGLGFISNGLSQVDHVELSDLDGKVFYRDDFN
jgi:hypothetical protein